MKICFTAFTHRAKSQGEKVLLFRRGLPVPEVYATFSDRELADAFGEAMCFVAATLNSKSNGRVAATEVFNSLLKHCQSYGEEHLREVVEALAKKPSA